MVIYANYVCFDNYTDEKCMYDVPVKCNAEFNSLKKNSYICSVVKKYILKVSEVLLDYFLKQSV